MSAAEAFPARRYFVASGACLLLALLAGVWAITIVAFSSPGDEVSIFTKIRPLHVTFAVSWIFIAAIAGVYAFLSKAIEAEPVGAGLARLQFWLLVAAGMIAIGGYLTGNHSGREYLNFPWPAACLILAAWACFAANFFRTAIRGHRRWPVYVWMWATGMVMFTYTFIEGHLWVLPWFHDAPVRDISVQWKSYGALTGSWNMFVYGLSMCLMERLSGPGIARSGKAFAFYWLGLTNLLFGWAHHTYALPQGEWIRWMAFTISMTEWVVLASLIWDWAQPFNRELWRREPENRIPRAFMAAVTVWVGLNLVLALLFSVPYLNYFTHGTQVTVAHAMGTTVGINSMILFAVGFSWLLARAKPSAQMKKHLWIGLLLTNIGLLGFFLLLVIIGVTRGIGTLQSGWSFAEMRAHIGHLLIPAGWLAIAMFLGLLTLVSCWLSMAIRRAAPETASEVSA